MPSSSRHTSAMAAALSSTNSKSSRGVGPIDEEPHRSRALDVGKGRAGLGEVERIHHHDVFTVGAQRLTAGRDDANALPGAHERLGELGNGFKEMLTVVKDDHEVPNTDRIKQRVHELAPGLRTNTEHRGHGPNDRVIVTGIGQLAQPSSIPVREESFCRGMDRQPGLPTPLVPVSVTMRDSFSASDTRSRSTSRPTNVESCSGRFPGKAVNERNGGKSLRIPGAVTWKRWSGRVRSRSECSPKSSRPTSVEWSFRIKSAVVWVTTTCPPLATFATCAALFTVVPG